MLNKGIELTYQILMLGLILIMYLLMGKQLLEKLLLGSKKGEEIVNFIRGLCPFPCANTSFIGLETQKRLDFKVFKGVFIENKEKKMQEFWTSVIMKKLEFLVKMDMFK